MDTVNGWIAIVIGVLGILGAVGAMLRWTADRVVRRLDLHIDEKLDTKLAPVHAELADIRQDLTGVHQHLDSLDSKVDHIAEVVDLRMRPLEADMALIKQRLLGTPAA